MTGNQFALAVDRLCREAFMRVQVGAVFMHVQVGAAKRGNVFDVDCLIFLGANQDRIRRFKGTFRKPRRAFDAVVRVAA